MTRVRRRVRALGLVAPLVLVAAACGSRVDLDDRAAAAAASDGSLGGAGAQSGSLTSATTFREGSTGQGPVGASQSAATSPTGGANAGGASAAPVASADLDSGPATGFGWDEEEIRIGYLLWSDVSNAGSAVGYAVDYGDQERIATAITDDLNARGGIAGRKVVPVFYDYQTGDLLTNGPGADQAACSHFTEDTDVFAVIAVTGPQSEVLPQCLYDHQVALIANDNIPYPRTYWERWTGFIHSTANPMTERLIPVWLQRSDAVGYFTGWDTTAGGPSMTAPVKIGIVRANAESGELFRDIVADALADLGHEITSDYALDSAFDTNGMSSAVLQFRSAGVTHVIVESLFLLLFPQAAESQQYRPRYTVTTANAPLLVQSATPPQQLNGAVGVGYFPSYDVDTAHDPGDPSPAAAHCREIQAAAGNDPNQRESWNLQTKACDAFAFIAEAIRIAGLHTGALAEGAAQIRSLPPAGAFAITFGPGRPDGPGAVRDTGYDLACECFVFTSATNHPLP